MSKHELGHKSHQLHLIVCCNIINIRLAQIVNSHYYIVTSWMTWQERQTVGTNKTGEKCRANNGRTQTWATIEETKTRTWLITSRIWFFLIWWRSRTDRLRNQSERHFDIWWLTQSGSSYRMTQSFSIRICRTYCTSVLKCYTLYKSSCFATSRFRSPPLLALTIVSW